MTLPANGNTTKAGFDREHRLKVLYRIADLINSTTNSATLLRRILRETISALPAMSGFIGFLSDDGQSLRIAAAQDLPGTDIDALLPLDGVWGEAVQQAHCVRVEAATGSKNQRVAGTSQMAAPLRIDGKVAGVLHLNSNDGTAFSEDDEKLLFAVANQAARMIHTSRLYDRLTEQTRRLETLFDVGQALISPDPLPDILNRITDSLLGVMDVKQCSVLLINDSREMVLSAASGSAGRYVQRPTSVLPEGLLGDMLGKRQPVQVFEVKRPEHRKPGKVPARAKPTSLLTIPIFFQESLVGILNVYADRVRQFEPDEMRLLNAFASLCGIAIENARRYERVITAEQSIRTTDRLATLGTLSAEIAHEIRNPVTIITMLMHSLREEGAIAPGRAKDVTLILDKLERINRIVSQVLGFAKRRGMRLEWVDLNVVLEEVLFLVQHSVSAKRILVHKQLAPDLPAVLVDRGHMDQVFLNLVLNAIEAMSHGGILTVESVVTPPRKRSGEQPLVRVVVRDTGVGMTPELQEQIFLPFVTGREAGVGLGLFVSQKLLSQYDGKISVRSAPGEGASFAVNLPLTEEESES
ncbi:MAG: GAF domain-containing protein [Candidatus Sumerlaeaceae bacterium]